MEGVLAIKFNDFSPDHRLETIWAVILRVTLLAVRVRDHLEERFFPNYAYSVLKCLHICFGVKRLDSSSSR